VQLVGLPVAGSRLDAGYWMLVLGDRVGRHSRAPANYEQCSRISGLNPSGKFALLQDLIHLSTLHNVRDLSRRLPTVLCFTGVLYLAATIQVGCSSVPGSSYSNTTGAHLCSVSMHIRQSLSFETPIAVATRVPRDCQGQNPTLLQATPSSAKRPQPRHVITLSLGPDHLSIEESYSDGIYVDT
jgi:hypothetical protein